MSEEPGHRPFTDSKLVIAADGLPARSVREWANEKLFYINRCIDVFTTSMKDQWPRRVYVDLFSGPGLCVIEESGEEVRGSPLLAMAARYAFTDFYFNDVDPVVANALRARVTSVEVGTIPVIRNLDCNEAARDAADMLRLDEPGTLGLAVIDPTAFQITLEALQALTNGRRIDLIITLMTGHLRRFLEQPGYQRPLDAFFGSHDWRKFNEMRARGKKITYRELLDFYKDRLRTIGYANVDDDNRILNSRERTLYHLVFASKDPKGKEFFKKISRRKYSGQTKFDI